MSDRDAAEEVIAFYLAINARNSFYYIHITWKRRKQNWSQMKVFLCLGISNEIFVEFEYKEFQHATYINGNNSYELCGPCTKKKMDRDDYKFNHNVVASHS